MIDHLRTGDSAGKLGGHVNRQAGAGAFAKSEIVASRHQFAGRPRMLLGGAGGGMQYLGVYVPTASYNNNQVVVIQAGPSQGSYISVIDGNTNTPDSGQGWVQLASDYAAGVWT